MVTFRARVLRRRVATLGTRAPATVSLVISGASPSNDYRVAAFPLTYIFVVEFE